MKEIRKIEELIQGETNLLDGEIDPNELFKEDNSIDMENEKFVLLDDEGNPMADHVSVFNPKPLSEFGEKLSCYDDFKELLQTTGMLRMNGYQTLFRGHAKESFTLESSIVRSHVKNYEQEKEMLEKVKTICKSKGYERFKMPDFNENLFYLSIGRHLGINSRLLDWTAGFCDALAFLIEEKDDYMEYDGCLWLLVYDQNKYQLEKNKDPFSIDDSFVHILKEDYFLPDEEFLFPIGIDRRFKQHGHFTVLAENNLDEPFEKVARESGFELWKFVVPKETKQLLAMGNRLPSLSWLYGDQNDPIVAEVKGLNDLYDYDPVRLDLQSSRD